MDVVLDSNIFRGDILLRSKEIDILLDYLEKTGSSIVLPKIILDEVKSLYGRALQERIWEFNKALNHVKLTLTTQQELADLAIDAVNQPLFW